jgi:hypothetical protein
MNREGFLETIRRQYIEDIHEAYQACIHEGGQVIDYEKLTECLTKLMRTAARDGLPPADFEEMVYSTLPQAQGKVHFEIPAPYVKAA